jgi:hypothetical protein
VVELTGKQRYRAQHRTFGKDLVVLQVEMSGTVSDHSTFASRERKVQYYRDATLEDLTIFKKSL